MSEGDFAFYGTQEGRDGYDSIEWIAAQPWSNGAVSMAGNSWLGTTQWSVTHLLLCQRAVDFCLGSLQLKSLRTFAAWPLGKASGISTERALGAEVFPIMPSGMLSRASLEVNQSLQPY